MSTLPGQPVRPSNYGQTAIVYSAVESVSAIVDGAQPTTEDGHQGRLFNVPAGKPVRVPEEAARFFMDHFGYTGIVRVREIRSEEGVRYDVKGAHAESLAKLKEADERVFKAWLASVIEDYVKRNKPVPPPDERIARLMARRKYELADYGITPIGYREKVVSSELEEMKAQIANLSSAKNNEIESLKAKNAELEKMLEKLTQPKG